MKRFFVLVCVLACAGTLAAEQVWEGDTAVSAYGSFPSSGFYGASSSFPQNTLVVVQDSATGKEATVLIIDRSSANGLLLLLSRDAGRALGIAPGATARVRVTLAKAPEGPPHPGDLPYSPDSDIYPAAGAADPYSLAFLNRYLAAQKAPGAAVAAAGAGAAGAAAGAAPTSIPAPLAATPVKPAAEGAPERSAAKVAAAPTPPPAAVAASAPTHPPAAAPTPPPAQTTPPSAPPVTAEAAAQPTLARGEQPLALSLAPQEVEPANNQPPPISALPLPPVVAPTVSALALSSGAPPAAQSPQLVAPAPAPAPPGVIGAAPSPSALPTVQPPPAERAAIPAGTVPAAPAAPLNGPESLALAEPTPLGATGYALLGRLPSPEPPAALAAAPSSAPSARAANLHAQTAPSAGSPAGGAASPVKSARALVANRYYVQLGAFVESDSALAMAHSLSPLYPVSVYTAHSGTREIYKVMVGPLTYDEGGSVLYHFIDSGYHGAFLRKVE